MRRSALPLALWIAMTLAPAAKIRRDYDTQRKHLPRVLAAVREFERHCGLDEQSSREEISKRLREVFAASFAVPYYCDLFKERGYASSDVCSLDDLGQLPMLSRGDAAHHWTRFLALDASSEELCAVKSTGSTGEPLLALKDGYDQVHMWAASRFWLEHLQIELEQRPRVCLLDALPGGLEYEAELPVLNDGVLRRISTLRERPGERLAEFNPQLVFSDPAGLHWLSARERRPCKPRLLLSSAQYLPLEFRARFAAPILNYYALTECGPVAWECLREAGLWHVMSPDVFAESVDGEIVVTRLRPSAMPLIRYRTGDRGNVSFYACGCGVKGYAITSFEGRRQCWFINDKDEMVDAWQLAWLFKQFALTEFRVTQQAGSRFLVECPVTVDTSRLAPALREALNGLGWGDPVCEFRAAAFSGPQKPQPFVTLRQP